MESDRPARRQALAAAFILAAVVAVAYGMTLPAPVIYDDVRHVQDNTVFRLPFGLFWNGLASTRYFQFAGERTYQPLITLLHYLTHGSPPVYRLAGLALHAGNAFLVFLLGCGLLGDRKAGFAAALLFALFPTHTETVNLSSFKGHLLASGCTLAAMLCWAEGLARPRPWVWLAAYASYGLALLSKETGVAALGLLVLYPLLIIRGPMRHPLRRGWPFLALTAAYLWYRFGLLQQPGAFPESFRYSSFLSFGWYIKTLLVPYPLCLEHTMRAGWLLEALPVLFVIALGACLMGSEAREGRMLLVFCLLWIPASLLPFLHLAAFANVSPVADRYLYLASVGPCLLLARAWRGIYGRCVIYAVFLCWGGLTIARNGLYRTPRALFEQTAACAPDNARAHYLVGLDRLQDRDYDAARAAFNRVLRLRESPGAYTCLGDIDRAQGRLPDAVERYRRARRLQPDWDVAHIETLQFLIENDRQAAERH